MSAEYPLFIVLDDRSVFLAKTEGDLRWFEQIDIENHEYGPCWDTNGRPQELTWQGVLRVEPVASPPAPSAVLEALWQWAVIARVELDASEDNPVALWESINAALRKRRDQTFLGRAARLFRGLWKPQPRP